MHYLSVYTGRFHKPMHTLSAEAKRRMVAYDWPGNVRELMNICERLAALSDRTIIDREQVDTVLSWNERSDGIRTHLNTPAHDTMGTLGSLESAAILAALEAASHNKSRAAAELGISRTTLWRKLKALGHSSDLSTEG
jgi:DNA-binding NtrC family response regulator